MAIPAATLTFKLFFFPRIGSSTSVSQYFNIFFVTPVFSFPTINTVGNFGCHSYILTLFLVCSKATISYPSAFNFFNNRTGCFTYSQAIHFSAPKETLSKRGWGGVGVNPVRYNLSTPAPSAVRNIAPTLWALRILGSKITKLFFSTH